MSNSDDLYAELRPDIEALTAPLFDLSESLVQKRGQFLPHGAVLDSTGETRMMMAAPPGFEERAVSAIEVLPMLHEGLRAAASKESLRAIAVCEDVTIVPEGEKKTAAIKVLVEHRRGLSVVLYLPYSRKLLGGYKFGSVFAKPASPEVRIWIDGEIA
jgi:hypothetical protein